MPRLGPGPVFLYECLSSSRRWQGYASRSFFLLILLITLLVVDHRYELSARAVATFESQSRQGRIFFDAIVATQLTLLFLAAPAATAGAICLEKARGSLAHLLVTDLSDGEIVFGKLSARLMRILGLLACTFPVTAALILMGGIEPEVIVGAFGVSLAVAVFGCALGMVLSVWARKAHQVLLIVLGFWGVCLLASPALEWLLDPTGLGTRSSSPLLWLNPYCQALGPLEWPGEFNWRSQLTFSAGALGLSVLMVAFAVAKLRIVTLRQLNAPARPRQRRVGRALAYLRREVRWLTGPILDINPVAWREWHRRIPTRAGLILRRLYTGLLIFLMFLAVLRYHGVIQMGLGLVSGTLTALCLLMLGISAATSLTEERVQGSLDVLMATPLSTPSIVWGKWWGTIRGALPLAVPPFVIAYVPFLHNIYRWEAPWIVGATVLSQAALVTGLGLALSTLFRRTDRAVVLLIVIYLLVSIGGIFLSVLLFRDGPGDPNAPLLCMASPFFAVTAITGGAERAELPDRMWDNWVAGAELWVVLGPIVAAALYGAVLLSFDRCLGRVRFAGLQAPESRWNEDDTRVELVELRQTQQPQAPEIHWIEDIAHVNAAGLVTGEVP